MNITEVTRRDILDYFITSKITFSGKMDELEFLGRIWNLSDMPSWDGDMTPLMLTYASIELIIMIGKTIIYFARA